MNKTRKHYKKHIYSLLPSTNAKKGTHIKCRLKSCRARKYKSVYGGSSASTIRSTEPLFY